MNAFSYDWSKLNMGTKDVLWANPPFSMLEKVVTKLILEPCKMCYALQNEEIDVGGNPWTK